MNRRTMLKGVSATLVAAATPAARAAAETYPSKPVRVIVPWEAGGSTDLSARALMTAAERHFPQPLAVVNKPGAGGIIGTTEALRSRPDGYTILYDSWSSLVIQPSMRDVTYREDDYVPVLQVNHIPRILTAHPSTPYTSMKEFMEYAKANPGKVKIGFSGVGTTGHLAMLQLEQDFDVKFTLVPLQGGGPTKTALLGGHVDVAPLNPPEAGPLLRAGQLKALATLDTKRFADFPQVPTAAEQGYAVDSLFVSLVAVPKGTPPEVIQVLHDTFRKAMDDPGFKEQARKLSMGVEYLDGEATRAKLRKYASLYGGLITKLGLRKAP